MVYYDNERSVCALYTEMVKIIEGGLLGDREKVKNYATVLADNLEQEGEIALAKKVRTVLMKRRPEFTSLDSFSTKPVDTESRMDIVEISNPQISKDQLVLSKYIEDELNSFVECYHMRDDLLKAGLEISNSLLLYGPPGCGKTTVAQYISSITNLPLVTARLDGLISSLLGSTAKNIRKIFDYVAKRECILFLDEFDVIAKLRDDKNELGELKRVVNSLIQNIDSLNNNSILIAATNHHELLDPAIWRRFSKVMTLERPQKDEISRLLMLLLIGYPCDFQNNDKKMEQVICAFEGFSHSNIKTVIKNAIRDSIIKHKTELNICDVLKEIYFNKHHEINDEDKFILFLLKSYATHKEINENLGISLRKIQAVSKNMSREEIDG